TPYDRSFESKTLLQRCLTLFAGPFMNFILALFIYLIINFIQGVPNYDSSVIGSVGRENTYLIDENGDSILNKNDKIIEINGVSISSWKDVSSQLNKLLDKNETEVSLKIEGEDDPISVECYTYIASLGLSNIQFEKKDFPSEVKEGIIVGNTSLRYLDDKDKGEFPLSKGDIITKVRVDTVNKDKTIVKGEEQSITSWSEMVEIFKKVDVGNVYFEYYSYAKGGIVSIDDCAALQTYGNEVLENQRIEKIQVKIGITPTTKFSFFGSIGNTFSDFWNDFTLIFRTLKLLIFPSKSVRQVGVSDLSSFVGIFSLIQTFVASGLLSLLAFMAMLSVNIGVMNLLPIPALDGGRIVFLGYELVTRKKPSKKVENIINNVFFILLMALFVYVTYNDIIRLIRK
ncbi:MAG: site-2 protease family protein, partial [Anaeroplasmataceae bacterium]|nr:site-2 protease family protein [Anaeroplasmataceae bacterium]